MILSVKSYQPRDININQDLTELSQWSVMTGSGSISDWNTVTHFIIRCELHSSYINWNSILMWLWKMCMKQWLQLPEAFTTSWIFSNPVMGMFYILCILYTLLIHIVKVFAGQLLNTGILKQSQRTLTDTVAELSERHCPLMRLRMSAALTVLYNTRLHVLRFLDPYVFTVKAETAGVGSDPCQKYSLEILWLWSLLLLCRMLLFKHCR